MSRMKIDASRDCCSAVGSESIFSDCCVPATPAFVDLWRVGWNGHRRYHQNEPRTGQDINSCAGVDVRVGRGLTVDDRPWSSTLPQYHRTAVHWITHFYVRRRYLVAWWCSGYGRCGVRLTIKRSRGFGALSRHRRRCSNSIHRVEWRHRIYGHDTIAILWYNVA